MDGESLRNQGSDIPPELEILAREVFGRGWNSAKRLVVSKVGSVARGERFDDDVADAVFLRIQQNAQVGRYALESEVESLGRNARRLTGEGTVRLYRAAPPGAGIRPGDFATENRAEAGNYRHGGHVLHIATVSREDVYAVDGSVGGGQEYVYLPRGYVRPEPIEYFPSFKAFFDAVNAPEPDADMTSSSPRPR